MTRLKCTLTLAALTAALAISPASAATVLVDDFEGFTGTGPGEVLLSTENTIGPHPAAPWVELSDGGWDHRGSTVGANTNSRDWRIVDDPADPSNKVLLLTGEYDSSLTKTIPGGVVIPDGGAGSIAFRFRMGNFNDTFNGPSVGVGLTIADTTGDPNQAANWVNLNGRVNGQTGGTLEGQNIVTGIVNGSNLQGNISTSIEVDTWYDLTMEIDNSAKTYEVFISGGAFAPNTQLATSEAQTTFFFRDASLGDLTRVMLRPNNNNSSTNDFFYIDDIYVTGVPEPGTLGLAVVSLLGCLGMRRLA